MDGQISVSSMMARIRARNWIATLRPMATFAAPSKFSRPRNLVEATTRMELNTRYYLTNYVAVSFIIFSYAILSRPLLLFVGALISAMWFYLLRTPGDLRLTPTLVLQPKQKIMVASIVTGLLVLLTAGTTIFMVVGICGSVVALHAVFHTTPTAAEEAAADAIDKGEPMPTNNVEMSPV